MKNSDLWRELDAQARRHKLTWKWLKGHVGHPENERCDLMAGAEIDNIRKSHSRAQLAACLLAFQDAGASKQENLL